MKTVLSTVCVAGVMLGSLAIARCSEDLDAIMYFYRSPTKASFARFQSTVNDNHATLKEAGSEIPISVMIARISEKHGWEISDGAFSERARDILNGQSEFAKYIADDTAVDPQKLDVWWASFFATGDDRYLAKVLRYAGEELPHQDIPAIQLIGAATWSFKANCLQHKPVLDFATQQLQSPDVPANKKAFLEHCIEVAEQGMPNKALQQNRD